MLSQQNQKWPNASQKERKKLSHENHKMEGLPEEILQEIVSLSEISPLKTLIACRTSEHNDSDWAVPFESDWPFDRCLGKRLDEGTAALAGLNLDYFQTLRAWKAGTDRRTDNDEACGLLLLKDASAIYVFTDTTFYCYQRIGRMEKKISPNALKLEMRESLFLETRQQLRLHRLHF